MDNQTEQDIAEKCAKKMWQDDNASKNLAMELTSIAAGAASISMEITAKMTNGHKTCHGGYIFTLADSCFAFACNSRNQMAVAQHCSITYIAPAFEGDILKATAFEQASFGRNGIYDIRIINQNNKLIAEFRGHSRAIKGQHI